MIFLSLSTTWTNRNCLLRLIPLLYLRPKEDEEEEEIPNKDGVMACGIASLSPTFLLLRLMRKTTIITIHYTWIPQSCQFTYQALQPPISSQTRLLVPVLNCVWGESQDLSNENPQGQNCLLLSTVEPRFQGNQLYR